MHPHQVAANAISHPGSIFARHGFSTFPESPLHESFAALAAAQPGEEILNLDVQMGLSHGPQQVCDQECSRKSCLGKIS